MGWLTAILSLALALAIAVAAGRRRMALLPQRGGPATPMASTEDGGPGLAIDQARGSEDHAAFGPPPPATLGPPATTSTAALPTATIDPRRVGLIPGHWGYDSGAVCPDGLREVDVTTDVALRTQAILDTRGIAVDLLEEHDPDVPQRPMQGYRAAALISIHADSCTMTGASGFRASRWRFSASPERDDRLIDCIYAHYGAATLLPRHDSSITINMWNYYAFREIHPETPAAILELAFLGDDRAFVDAHRYSMALGVADAVSCFLDGANGR